MKLSKKYTNIIKDVVNETVNTQYLYHSTWKRNYENILKQNKILGQPTLLSLDNKNKKHIKGVSV